MKKYNEQQLKDIMQNITVYKDFDEFSKCNADETREDFQDELETGSIQDITVYAGIAQDNIYWPIDMNESNLIDMLTNEYNQNHFESIDRYYCEEVGTAYDSLTMLDKLENMVQTNEYFILKNKLYAIN